MLGRLPLLLEPRSSTEGIAMPELALTEVAAWALIASGVAFAAMQRFGAPASAVAAALVALATKSALLGA
jgi:hypothetical protein